MIYAQLFSDKVSLFIVYIAGVGGFAAYIRIFYINPVESVREPPSGWVAGRLFYFSCLRSSLFVSVGLILMAVSLTPQYLFGMDTILFVKLLGIIGLSNLILGFICVGLLGWPKFLIPRPARGTPTLLDLGD